MSYSCILYEIQDEVARISHNRPERRNAENAALLDEMDDALGRAVADPAVKVIIFGGEGDHFSAGHDVKEAVRDRPNATTEQRYEYENQRFFEYCLRIWN